MSKKFDTKYFFADDSVTTALEQYENGYKANAIENMRLILRAYGLDSLIDADYMLKIGLTHPLRRFITDPWLV